MIPNLIQQYRFVDQICVFTFTFYNNNTFVVRAYRTVLTTNLAEMKNRMKVYVKVLDAI